MCFGVVQKQGCCVQNIAMSICLDHWMELGTIFSDETTSHSSFKGNMFENMQN